MWYLWNGAMRLRNCRSLCYTHCGWNRSLQRASVLAAGEDGSSQLPHARGKVLKQQPLTSVKPTRNGPWAAAGVADLCVVALAFEPAFSGAVGAKN
jgi:hypothetical protein